MQNIKTEINEFIRQKDLLRATLVAGKIESPQFEASPYIDAILEIAANAWSKMRRHQKDIVLKVDAINQALFKSYGMEGKSDRYKQVIDDPDRYYLHRVLEKKQGCPLSLTIIYTSILQQLGIEHEVFSLPNYYLIKVKDITGDLYIDAFDGGKLLNTDDFHKKFRVGLERNRMISANLFEKMTTQQLVGKSVQQLKHIYILKGDALTALRAVEILSSIFPDSPEITRDRGILYCEMEYFSKAMEDLRFYLKRRPAAEDVSEIKKLTSMLKGYREIVN